MEPETSVKKTASNSGKIHLKVSLNKISSDLLVTQRHTGLKKKKQKLMEFLYIYNLYIHV